MSNEPQMYPVEPDVLRYKLNKAMPYFADVTYRLRPKPQEGELGGAGATFGVDEKFNWYYSTEVPFTPEEQVAVLYHEINHLIRNHHGRRGDKDQKLFNVAGDREINDWFPNGLHPPAMGVGSKKYNMNDLELPDNELAEWYFDRIDRYELHVREDAGPMTPGTGKCISHKGCDSKDVEYKKGRDHTVKQKGVMHVPVCGGAAGNGDGDPTKGNADGDGVSNIEAEAVRQAVAEKITKEAQMGRGNLPGGLVEWADAFLNPVVPWQKLLRTAARRASTIIAGDTSQTFTKPPRRSPPGIIMPKKIARRTVAAFYIDTSGSVSDEEIYQAVAEIKGALRTNLADLTISLVDTEVYSTTKAGHGTWRKPGKIRRGGTDMVKCFDHAAKLMPRPNLVIVMTDGQTPWPDEPVRDTRTIIVMTRSYADYKGHWSVPDWVWKVIEMEPKK